MASITVRNLEEELKRRLRIRAAENGRSMEEEARQILRTALYRKPIARKDLASAIRARFATPGRGRTGHPSPFTHAQNGPIRLKRLRMIILDTNVVSELMRPNPSPIVVDWVAAQAAPDLYLSTVSGS